MLYTTGQTADTFFVRCCHRCTVHTTIYGAVHHLPHDGTGALGGRGDAALNSQIFHQCIAVHGKQQAGVPRSGGFHALSVRAGKADSIAVAIQNIPKRVGVFVGAERLPFCFVDGNVPGQIIIHLGRFFACVNGFQIVHRFDRRQGVSLRKIKISGVLRRRQQNAGRQHGHQHGDHTQNRQALSNIPFHNILLMQQ